MSYVIGGLMIGLSALVLGLAWMLALMPDEEDELGAWQDSDSRVVRGIDGERLRRPRG